MTSGNEGPAQYAAFRTRTAEPETGEKDRVSHWTRAHEGHKLRGLESGTVDQANRPQDACFAGGGKTPAGESRRYAAASERCEEPSKERPFRQPPLPGLLWAPIAASIGRGRLGSRGEFMRIDGRSAVR